MHAGGGWSESNGVLLRMDAPPLGTGQGPGRRQLQGDGRANTLAAISGGRPRKTGEMYLLQNKNSESIKTEKRMPHVGRGAGEAA
jgi:hypothetical protein